MADPTDAIPPGHVFVTGVLGTDADLPELFVTRFPCTEARDGLMLPAMSDKPEFMTQAHWDFLCNLPLGAIVFGNALPGESSLPSKIAGGDLDGDNYFYCWNPTLLRQIETVPTAPGEYDDGIMENREHDVDWLHTAQTTKIANVSRLAIIFELISKLCNAQKKFVTDCGPGCPDARALGVAYKDSLEVAKHGRKIRLPRHLWDLLPDRVHLILTDAAGQPCEHALERHKAKNGRRSTRSTGNTEPAASRPDLEALRGGARVEIIGGTHKGKAATFVRLTAKMVRVQLLAPPFTETHVTQKYVRPASQ